ncbi:TetR/AcrR family transcriptional regulator [candidate division WOR-3 bacterium]|nr:TetR/AcrR family transcriptional regulator [candidate division WOR-3 bacterium]
MTRKEKEKIFKRDHILDSAEEILKNDGLKNLSMERIAVSSEFTRQTIYAYFKNREELLLILFLKESLVRWKYLEKATAGHDRGIKKLEIFGNSYYNYYKKKPNYLELALYYDNYGIPLKLLRKSIFNEFYEPNTSARTFFRDIFIKGQEEGSIRKDIDVECSMGYFCIALRAVLKEVICLKYMKKESFFEFMKIMIDGFTARTVDREAGLKNIRKAGIKNT